MFVSFVAFPPCFFSMTNTQALVNTAIHPSKHNLTPFAFPSCKNPFTPFFVSPFPHVPTPQAIVSAYPGNFLPLHSFLIFTASHARRHTSTRTNVCGPSTTTPSHSSTTSTPRQWCMSSPVLQVCMCLSHAPLLRTCVFTSSHFNVQLYHP